MTAISSTERNTETDWSSTDVRNSIRVRETDSAGAWSRQRNSNKKRSKHSYENGWLWKVKIPNTDTLLHTHLKCTVLQMKWQHLRQLYVKIKNFFFFFFFRRWTSFKWRFWTSQRHPSTLLYPGHRLTNFWSPFDQGPVWCCTPIYIWVFLLV